MKTSLPLIRVSTMLLAVVSLWWATPAKAQLARPTNLHATLLSNGSVYLTWTDNAQGEDGYNVYKQKQNPGPYVLINHGTDPNQSSYADSGGLVRGKTYYYYVAPYKGGVEGKKSNKVQITIGTPPAADIVVNTLQDHDDGACSANDCTLREAIKYVPPTGTVAFASGLNGTITLDLGLGQLTIDNPLTINGPGSNVITVSGGTAVRVFYIDTPTKQVTISDLTIAGGSSDYGSGILVNSGVVTVNTSNFSGNSAAIAGGGIYNDENGTLTVRSSTFANNGTTSTTALNGGGGIANAGRITVNNSTFSGNGTHIFPDGRGGLGGAIENQGTAKVSNSTFSGNSADAGGAIYNAEGTILVSNSTLFDNGADDEGGGIYNIYGTATVSNSTVSANGGQQGGGIFNNYGGGTTPPSIIVVSNSTITGNGAFDGGGIDNNGQLFVSNSTVYGNNATQGFGGGIYTGTAPCTLNNSIVAGNTASNAGPEVLGTVSSGDYSLVQDTGGATLSGTHNVTGVDPKLGPLQNNGGPTKTHALLSGSPAINAGSNALVPADYSDQDGDGNTTEPVPYDQRGRNTAPGELGFNRLSGTAVDIGAFELQSDPVIGP